MRKEAMKTRLLIFAMVLMTGTLSASSQKDSKTPVISAELKAQFFKAQLAVKSAQEVYQQAQAASQASVQMLIQACGKDFQPSMDQNGDPVCVANPVAKTPEGK